MTYIAKPYNHAAWTMTTGLWATVRADTHEIIDVYESREIAEAWADGANRRARVRVTE